MCFGLYSCSGQFDCFNYVKAMVSGILLSLKENVAVMKILYMENVWRGVFRNVKVSFFF